MASITLIFKIEMMKQKYSTRCVVFAWLSFLFLFQLFSTTFAMDSKKHIEIISNGSQIVYDGNYITLDDLKKLAEKYGANNLILNLNNKGKKISYENFCKVLDNIPIAEDAKESFEILNFLNNIFDTIVKNKIKPVIYRKPYRKKTVIKIYKLTEKLMQNKIIEILNTEIVKRKWKPIELKFYEKEDVNTIVHADETSYSRKNEKLLRTEIIVRQ